MIPLDEQIAAVERAAKGIGRPNRPHVLALMEAAESLRKFQSSRMTAKESLDASAARVAASLDRSRRP